MATRPPGASRDKVGLLGVIRQVHAWTGFALSLVIAIVSLSGAALVYKQEWLKLTVPGAGRSVTPDVRASAAAATAAESAFGPTAVRSVVLASPDFGLHQVYLRDEGGAYLDPRNGRVVQRWRENERAVDLLFDLHHHLLAGKTGTRISGWIGVAATLMVLTGLMVWAPAARSFRGVVAPRSLKRAGLLAAHRDLGVMAAPVVLVLALSGAAVALPEVARPMLVATAGAKPPTLPPDTGDRPSVDWTQAVGAAQTLFPDAELRVLVWSGKTGAPVEVRLRQPGEWHANGRTVVWTESTGALLAADDAQAQKLGVRLFNSFWPVHASKVGGLLWKTTAFLAGLSLAALSLFGAESFRRRLFRPNRAKTGRSGPWARKRREVTPSGDRQTLV